VAGALEEVCEEIRQLAGLEPEERTQEKAQTIWEDIDREGPSDETTRLIGALRCVLAELETNHSVWDTHADVIAAAVRAKQALSAYDHGAEWSHHRDGAEGQEGK